MGLMNKPQDSIFDIPLAYKRPARRATVYKVRYQGHDVAMKVFYKRYAAPENLVLGQQLRQFMRVPGLRVCDRRVITEDEARRSGAPGLSYAFLMPWIDGEPWIDMIEANRRLDRPSCFALACRTAEILAGLEKQGLAHTDISGGNLIINNIGPRPAVELVGVEKIYHPSFIDIPSLVDGTPGYIYPGNKGKDFRNPYGDRFAGSILLTEMLVWHDEWIRASIDEGSLFGQEELCKESGKFRGVSRILRTDSPRAADLFTQAWESSSLSECPSLADWRSALRER
jgi:hypothetical protein